MAAHPPGQEVFDAYPELARPIDALCERPPWRITGVSAILFDDDYLYFEVAKPKHWQRRADGALLVGIGGIGGSIEEGETVLGCLEREAQEEIGLALDVVSAAETHFIYEERWRTSLSLERRAHPLPVLFTISANRYRQRELAPWPTLAIITFLARPLGQPILGDLFGLLAVPRALWRDLFLPDVLPYAGLQQDGSVRLLTASPLPPETVFVPIWTARSLRCLVRAGLGLL